MMVNSLNVTDSREAVNTMARDYQSLTIVLKRGHGASWSRAAASEQINVSGHRHMAAALFWAVWDSNGIGTARMQGFRQQMHAESKGVSTQIIAAAMIKAHAGSD